MKLTKYTNLYAHFYSYSKSRSNEAILEYDHRTNIYRVTLLKNWVIIYSDMFHIAADAFKYFNQLKGEL